MVSNENETCDDLLTSFDRIGELQQQICQCQSTIKMIEESIAVHLSKNPEEEDNILETFKPKINFYFQKIKSKVSNCISLLG